MAIKASASITLSAVVDVASTTRYYLLQSSTLNKPSVPTTNPPSGSWDDTEPSYTEGSTNSLYFVDLTVFSDDSFSYSAVSLSSSYEAAKAAYNKATAAQSSATQVASRVTAVEQKVTDSAIENVVKSSTTYKNLEGRVTSTESNISTVSQTADKINWIVSSDATSSNVALTDAAYSVIADNIDLSANNTVKISSADQIDISAVNNLNLSSNGTITLMAGNISSAASAASNAQSTADSATTAAGAAQSTAETAKSTADEVESHTVELDTRIGEATLKAATIEATANEAKRKALENANNFARYIELDNSVADGGLKVGDNTTNSFVRIRSDSVELCVDVNGEPVAVATFAHSYLRLRNMQIRVPEGEQGLVLSVYEEE